MKRTYSIVNVMTGIALGYLATVGVVLAAQEPTTPLAAPQARAEDLAGKWGIQVTSLRLSANGYMVDFRYKVVDPQKAATLSDPTAKPYLVDQVTGIKLQVPKSPKVGPLRQSAENLTAGKVYFTLFANPGKKVKAGSKVTVVIGKFKAENMVVE